MAGFAPLFPVPTVRRFYALYLPHGQLATTLVAATAGTAALVCFWGYPTGVAADRPGCP